MKKFLAGIFLSLLGLLLFTGLTFAANDRQQRVVVLPQTQVINQDYFAAGDTVQILGTVNGDLYTAGGNVDVVGTVTGDVLAAGGNVTISGNVDNDVRVAGGNIHIIGTVGKNVTAVGGNVEIASDAKLGGSLTGAGGQFSILAPITKSITLAGGQATLGSSVGGDVLAFIGNLTLTPNASVNGDLTYQSNETAAVASGATVSGKITHQPAPEFAKKEQVDNKKLAFGILTFITWLKLIGLISTFIVGLVIIKLLPVYAENVSDMITTRPWASLGLGLVTLLVSPILGILLLLTVFGIPLAFFLFGIFLLLLYLSKILVLMVVGRKLVRLLSPKAGLVWGLLVGAIVYELVTFITPLNALISLLTYSIGLGSLLLVKKNYYQSLRTKKLV